MYIEALSRIAVPIFIMITAIFIGLKKLGGKTLMWMVRRIKDLSFILFVTKFILFSV